MTDRPATKKLRRRYLGAIMTLDMQGRLSVDHKAMIRTGIMDRQIKAASRLREALTAREEREPAEA